MATITVDGRSIEAPAGAPLVEVLKNNGVYVSSLCYIDGLKPYAGCRSCLVDIEGPPGLQLSCTATIQDGMVVRVATDEVNEARKSVISIILANHSDRCLTCHRREHCHPGDICLRDDVVTHRCLTCSKNYRCELQVTCEAVGMSGYEPWVGEERTFYQHPQPPADRANPFMEFDPQMCIICTRCQRACEDKRHTGAITLSGKGWDARIAFGAGGPIHDSNCDFSGACIDVCPTAALMEHPNKWVAKPDLWTSTTCDSCAVGCSLKIGSAEGRGVIVRPGDANAFSGDQICVRGRYHYDSLKPRERLSRHLVRRGNIQAPASLETAVEEAATALKSAAARGKVGVLVGPTVTNEEAWVAQAIARSLGSAADSSLGPVARAVTAALEARLGTRRVAADMTRIPKSKAIVVVADDLEESHNVASVRVKDAVARERAKLIVVGALRSELVDFATVWIRPSGGDEGFAAARLAAAVAGSASGDSDTDAAAAILRDADRAATVVICAPNNVRPSVAGAMAGGAANLAVALWGDAASENLVVLPSEVNVNGLLDLGVAAAGSEDPLAGLEGVLLVRDDPTLRLPGAAEALARIPAVVVLDNVLHPSAKAAAAVIAEGRAYASSGTYTQGDFRVQRLSPAIRPEGDAVPMYTALSRLATALGVDVPADPVLALDAIAREHGEYQPAADLIIGEGVRMAIRGSSIGRQVAVESLAQTSDITLITARDLYTAADAAALRHRDADKLHRYDRVQVSEADAGRLGIRNGDDVRLAHATGALTAQATVTDRVPTGAVFVSSLMHGGIAAQLAEHTLRLENPAAVAAAAAPVSTVPRPPSSAVPVAAPLAPAVPLADAEGDVQQIVGDAVAAQLRGLGISWVRELLDAGAAPEGRRGLAGSLGVAASAVLEWVNRADLMRIPGVTAELADLLENAGVDTVKELARRRADNLHTKLSEVIGAMSGQGPGLTAESVAGWVEAAGALAPRVMH